jgi:hypothetical protein
MSIINRLVSRVEVKNPRAALLQRSRQEADGLNAHIL